LKKEANAVSHERDLERAQRRKLELELGKKVKQINELLSSGHITVRVGGWRRGWLSLVLSLPFNADVAITLLPS